MATRSPGATGRHRRNSGVMVALCPARVCRAPCFPRPGLHQPAGGGSGDRLSRAGDRDAASWRNVDEKEAGASDVPPLPYDHLCGGHDGSKRAKVRTERRRCRPGGGVLGDVTNGEEVATFYDEAPAVVGLLSAEDGDGARPTLHIHEPSHQTRVEAELIEVTLCANGDDRMPIASERLPQRPALVEVGAVETEQGQKVVSDGGI